MLHGHELYVAVLRISLFAKDATFTRDETLVMIYIRVQNFRCAGILLQTFPGNVRRTVEAFIMQDLPYGDQRHLEMFRRVECRPRTAHLKRIMLLFSRADDIKSSPC